MHEEILNMSDQKRLVYAVLTLFLSLMSCMENPPLRADDQPSREISTDRSLFPEAYGVLANDKLMFPVDMSDWPIKLTGERQLFVDDYLIASSINLKRTVHQATKHPGNPIISDETPWEGKGPAFQIVRRNPQTGKFRIWYSGAVTYQLPSGHRGVFPALYAESDDGINWVKPELGLYEFNGSKANNIIIPAGNLFGLHVDDHEPNPQRRYKGIVAHRPKYVAKEGYFLYTSPDGIHWTRDREEPLALSLQGYTMPQSGVGDTSLFRWDRHLGKYIGDVKFVLPGKIRCRGFMESDDLIHWTRPRMTVYPDTLDDPDSQIYSQNSFCYESMWLGFLRVMHTERTQGYKQTTVELTASRDGRHWSRIGRREEVIPLGTEAEWDTDYHDPFWEPVPVGDQIWIYYRSARLRRNEQRRYRIGLAMLRRDGFVSLDAGNDPGVIVTRPLSFGGKKLFINARVNKGGYVKAALISPENTPVSQYGLADCISVTVDAVKSPVVWTNAQDILLSPGDHLRLKFELKNAQLYSFWIE
jgi:hypothetical protein